jgi:hypothetical protein
MTVLQLLVAKGRVCCSLVITWRTHSLAALSQASLATTEQASSNKLTALQYWLAVAVVAVRVTRRTGSGYCLVTVGQPHSLVLLSAVLQCVLLQMRCELMHSGYADIKGAAVMVVQQRTAQCTARLHKDTVVQLVRGSLVIGHAHVGVQACR